MTRRQYHDMWSAFQIRYERIYTTVFKKALRQQVEDYIGTGYMTSQPIYAALTQLYKDVGPKWAAKTGIHRKKPVSIKARAPMGFTERIVELMQQYYGIDLLNDAEGITDVTREKIRIVLSDASYLGYSVDEIISEFPLDFGAKRARRIARTETETAANGAAIINAKETGLPMLKIWIAVRDKRTRHNHAMVDNVTIPIDDAFNVGGEMMEQPGARRTPEGLPVSGANCINCRCCIAFKIIDT